MKEGSEAEYYTRYVVIGSPLLLGNISRKVGTFCKAL